MEKTDHKLSFEYNQIDDNIFIGTSICCVTHFKEELLKQGITADISLEEDKIDAPFGVDSYLWLPTSNNTAPSKDQIEIGAHMMNSIIKQGRKIYVHCQFGHGRGPTLVAAYYIYKGMEVDEAIAKIKAKRPVVHPNETQIKALQEFKG